MLSRSDLSELADAINDEIAPFMMEGGGNARVLAEKWVRENRKLFRRYAYHLAENNLTEKFRHAMKKWDAVPLSADQYDLPEFAQHLLRRLPGALFVPPAEGAAAEDQKLFRPVFAGAMPITVGEARRALAHLRLGIDADQKRANALSDALSIAESVDAPEDETLLAAIRRAGDSK